MKNSQESPSFCTKRRPNHRTRRGFTLIELSIVLVVIGLIVGGIMVGRDLIQSAAVRAQIAQIDKYNTAVHAFVEKYGYLPGDIPNPYAGSFGFQSRGSYAGEGDGNGVIEGIASNSAGEDYGTKENGGETTTFWVDLSTANMIDGGFNTASPTVISSYSITLKTSPAVGAYLPAAKIGNGNYVYVWSGGSGLNGVGGLGGNNQNYFGLSAVTSIDGASGFGGRLYTTPGLTIQQAYNIDNKIDDGLPQSGTVTALYLNGNLGGYAYWAAGGGVAGASPGVAASPSSTTCYDNGNGSSNVMQYTLSSITNNGNNLNCSLSFQFVP